MKKILIALTLVSVLFGSYAHASSDDRGNNVFQLIIGPMIDVRDWGANQFTMGINYGGKYVRFGVNYGRMSANNVTMNAFKPYFLIDIPFSFDIGQKSQLAIGPVIDFGPSFGFAAGEKIIDVMQLGYGLDVKFYFNDNIGLSVTPIHFTDSFATYTTGGIGFTKQFRMSYDLLFSFLLRW